MPYCEVKKYQEGGEASSNGIKIFYQTHGHGNTKVLLIIGLAGTHDSWGPQIKGLTGTETPNKEELLDGYADRTSNLAPNFHGSDDRDGGDDGDGIQVCSFDNRGMGKSSVPTKKSEYTTTIMAGDALALMDHLGWKKAHVFGHSMGAMVACKLASMAPDRILSLALLNATGGGYECFPKIDSQMISIALRFLKARTPEQRAAVDLDTHYTKEYLDEYVGSTTRRKILYQEYAKAISSTGMQSNYGFEGQVNACWTHKMTSKEYDVIRSSGFLISVIHGRHDIIAQVHYARKIAEILYPNARMIELHGGHLVSHERPEEVNQALMELIKASKSKLDPQEWSNLSVKEVGCQELGLSMPSRTRINDRGSCFPYIFDLLTKLQLRFVYFFGLFVMAFEHARRIFSNLKPVRVGASLT